MMLFYFQILLDIVESIHRKNTLKWSIEWCLIIIIWISGTRLDEKNFERTPKKGKHPTIIVAIKKIGKM